MYKTAVYFLILAGWATVTQPASVSAQAQNDTVRKADSGADRFSNRRVGKREQAEQLKKLQAAMKKKLELDAEQESAIDDQFARYFRQLDVRRGRSGLHDQNSAAMKKLRAEMRAARKSGDKARVKQLGGEFKIAMRVRNRDDSETMPQFLNKVEQKLNASQRSEFDALVRKLKINRSTTKRGDQLRALSRAVMSQEMRLSGEQRAAVLRLLREGMSSANAAKRKGNADEAQRIASSTREDILKELTSQQRSKLEQRLGATGKNKQSRRANRKERPATNRDGSQDDAEKNQTEPEDDDD